MVFKRKLQPIERKAFRYDIQDFKQKFFLIPFKISADL